jgi:hypothetical protein
MLWPFYLHESASIIHRVGVRVGPRASLDVVEKKKNSCWESSSPSPY